MQVGVCTPISQSPIRKSELDKGRGEPTHVLKSSVAKATSWTRAAWPSLEMPHSHLGASQIHRCLGWSPEAHAHGGGGAGRHSRLPGGPDTGPPNTLLGPRPHPSGPSSTQCRPSACLSHTSYHGNLPPPVRGPTRAAEHRRPEEPSLGAGGGWLGDRNSKAPCVCVGWGPHAQKGLFLSELAFGRKGRAGWWPCHL